jgi:RHS repeat-associated protein
VIVKVILRAVRCAAFRTLAAGSALALAAAGFQPASAAAGHPAQPATIATSGTVPLGTGPTPGGTFLRFPISDKASLQVNVGSGNALFATSDIVLPEAAGALALGQAYNSLLVGSAYTGADGNGWRQREGVDVRLYPNADGSVTLLGEDGIAATFTAPTGGGTTFGSPAVFHATLTTAPDPHGDCGGEAYGLTWHQTGEEMCFESNGLLDAAVDRNGNFTAYTYNASGQETEAQYYPAGELTTPAEAVTVSYTGSHLTLLSQSGGSAGTRSVAYGINASGDLTSVRQADGTTLTLGYDGSHDLTSITNGAGAVTALAYNASRQVTSVTQHYGSGAAAATTRLSYVSATQTQVATPTTNQSLAVSSVPHTTYTINAQDQVTQAIDPVGDTRATTYTPLGDVATATNGLTGGTTTDSYTANGGESLTSAQLPTGAKAQLAYGSANTGTDPTAEYLPSTGTGAQGNATAYTYDGSGNLYRAVSALPATASLTYEENGAPATSTDPNGGQTTYGYNSFFQLTSITPPASGSLQPIGITYDGFGRVATVTSGAGNTVTYTYDLADRVTREAFTGGTHTLTVSYAYDSAGNVHTQTDASGTTTWTYDPRNHALSKTATSGGGTLAYGYDADGNLTSAQDAAGTTSYTYNSADQLASLTDTAGKLWEFTYNGAGERAVTYFATNAAETTWAVKYVTSYDAAGRVTRLQALGNSGASTISDVSYCYSPYVSGGSCPTASATTDTSLVQYSVNNQTSVVSQYTYDHADRLTKVTNDNGTTYTYGYDNDGNLTSGAHAGSLSYNTSNQVTSSGYGYDGAGDLTADPANGSLTYNDAGQLISASAASGGGAGSGAETFTYAGATQDEPLSDGSATAITYGLAGQEGVPAVDSYTTGGAANYVIRDQQGDPLGMTRGGTSYIFLTDNIGSVTTIAGTCGCSDASYSYTPYGTLAAKSAGSGGSLVTENLIGYTGTLTDAFTAGSTGYVHDGSRWYNPSTGGFTSQDPNSYLADPADGNRYAYAADNPANYTDPTGQSVFDAVIGVIAAAAFVFGTVVAIAAAGPEIGALTLAGLVIGITAGEPLAVVALVCGFTGC